MAAEIFLEMVPKPDIYNGLHIDFNQLPNGKEVNVEEFDEKLVGIKFYEFYLNDN